MGQRVTQQFAEPVRATEPMVAASRPSAFRRRTWFAVTLAAICAVHAGLLATFFSHDDPVATAKTDEVPIEVVAEVPKPPAPEPRQNPPSPTPQPDEKPATSAPRAQNDETRDREADDGETRAPGEAKAAASPPHSDEARPSKPQEAAREPKPVDAPQAVPQAAANAGTPAAATDAAAPSPEPTDAEALDKAPPEPPRRPAEIAKMPPKPPARPVRLASAAPRPAPQAVPTAIDQLAGASDLPDYQFSKAQRKPTKFKGGSEANRYLAIIFAMVMPDQRPVPLTDDERQVAVDFEVDGHGSLIGIRLRRSSGDAELDDAALDLVRQAAPFPPPPSGGVTSMVAAMWSSQIAAQQRYARTRYGGSR